MKGARTPLLENVIRKILKLFLLKKKEEDRY